MEVYEYTDEDIEVIDTDCLIIDSYYERRTYGILAIARRHPEMFSSLILNQK